MSIWNNISAFGARGTPLSDLLTVLLQVQFQHGKNVLSAPQLFIKQRAGFGITDSLTFD